jgi:hypothetical protein
MNEWVNNKKPVLYSLLLLQPLLVAQFAGDGHWTNNLSPL